MYNLIDYYEAKRKFSNKYGESDYQVKCCLE